MDWLPLAVTVVLQAVKDSVKNPVRKARLRPTMLKVGAVICAVFGDDENFMAELDLKARSEKAKLGE